MSTLVLNFAVEHQAKCPLSDNKSRGVACGTRRAAKACHAAVATWAYVHLRAIVTRLSRGGRERYAERRHGATQREFNRRAHSGRGLYAHRLVMQFQYALDD